MATLLVIQEKQLIAQQDITTRQHFAAQDGATLVIDQNSTQLPQIRFQHTDQVWLVFGENEGLLLDIPPGNPLFLHTPTQNYQLLAGQWPPVSGQPWAGETILAETVIAPVSESASIALSRSASRTNTSISQLVRIHGSG